MKILQLIDTLEPGGAERMAVNYANLIKEKGHVASLISTRRKGGLLRAISEEVNYFHLGKKHSLDLIALKRLQKFISDNKIDVVQAHGSSWFYAVICKMSLNNFVLIWHDHFGNSEFLQNRASQPLKYFSGFFDGIISVNENLKTWALQNLKCEKAIFINNFIDIPAETAFRREEGDKKKLKLVCLANMRKQKDHFSLLEACDLVKNEFDIEVNLIGKDFKDIYSGDLKKELAKRNYIKYHGEVEEPSKILQNMDIGVLSSRSEGLPLAILEYGANALPVVSTNVGQIHEVIGEHGILVEPGDSDALVKGIKYFASNESQRIATGKELKRRVHENYSKDAVFEKYMNFLDKLC